jgi:hypothetical protein
MASVEGGLGLKGAAQPIPVETRTRVRKEERRVV